MSSDKSTDIPILTGYMVKRGRFIPTWNRRFFELYTDRLIYYSEEDRVSQKGVFELHADTMCHDSSNRHFCFCLYQPGNEKRSDILYVATYTMEEKENWMGMLHYFEML